MTWPLDPAPYQTIANTIAASELGELNQRSSGALTSAQIAISPARIYSRDVAGQPTPATTWTACTVLVTAK